MKLRKISDNILYDDKSKVSWNYIKRKLSKNRYRVIGFIIICIISICICVGSLLYKNNIATRYESFLNSYNAVVDEYNSYVLSYNTLRDRLNNEIESIPESWPKKEYCKITFEDFQNSGVDFSITDQELSSVSEETVSLKAAYNEFCRSAYDEIVGKYNDKVEKYNILLEKLKGYGISSVLGEPYAEKKEIDDEVTFGGLCGDVETIWEELSQIIIAKNEISSKYHDICLMSYNCVINDYNLIAKAYNDLVQMSSVDYIESMPESVKEKLELDDLTDMGEEEIYESIENTLEETEAVVKDYLLVQQITNPAETWVKERLKKVESIKDMQAVSENNDPNELLGKEGGYTSCIYFSVNEIQDNQVAGSNIVEKGTDIGGAIEIYDTLEYALNRCDYLSQFDGTLLYSGSYTVVGTMVVRTSYILSNQQQVDLTDDIIYALTMIEQ